VNLEIADRECVVLVGRPVAAVDYSSNDAGLEEIRGEISTLETGVLTTSHRGPRYRDGIPEYAIIAHERLR